MKKNVKRILVLLVALSLVFVFCGCDGLDEMRNAQAFSNVDGTITWQGNTYKLLPSRTYFNPDISNSTPVFVTEPDVPVLLSTMFAEKTFYATMDNKILVSTYGETTHYCIDSEYDAMCERLRAPFEPEIVCYQYGFYNEETGYYETRYYTLTQEQVDAVNLVIETVEPTVLSDGMYIDTWYAIRLEECSKDMLFRKDAMHISYSGSTYYIELYTPMESTLFAVPAGCNAIFDEIFKAYLEGEGYFKPDMPATDEII